jgi:ATP-dependent DNA ligase
VAESWLWTQCFEDVDSNCAKPRISTATLEWPHHTSTVILLILMPPQFQPMPLLKRRLRFDDPDFIFEIKWDGFRALALIEHGRAQLNSRNGHRFSSFADLEKLISAGLPNITAVIDGEFALSTKRDGHSSETCSFIVEIIRAFSLSICS